MKRDVRDLLILLFVGLAFFALAFSYAPTVHGEDLCDTITSHAYYWQGEDNTRWCLADWVIDPGPYFSPAPLCRGTVRLFSPDQQISCTLNWVITNWGVRVANVPCRYDPFREQLTCEIVEVPAVVNSYIFEQAAEDFKTSVE